MNWSLFTMEGLHASPSWEGLPKFVLLHYLGTPGYQQTAPSLAAKHTQARPSSTSHDKLSCGLT